MISDIPISNKLVFNFQEFQMGKAVTKQKTWCEVIPFKYKDKKYALKIIHKDEIPMDRFEQQYKRVQKQIKSLYYLNHPNVIKLYYHDQTQNTIRMIEQYGGTRLKAAYKTFLFNQELTIKIVKQILQGLKYIHQQGYIHRDLQPQNILYSKNQQNIKLIDFGFVDQISARKTYIGSYQYMAPEITGDNYYNQKIDIWSLGVIVYQMLHNQNPFCYNQEFTQEIFEENKRNLKLSFDSRVSQQAVKFIKKMLVINPEDRPSAAQLLNDQFIQPEIDFSAFDREGMSRKTHKIQYPREKSAAKQPETIRDLEKRLQKTISDSFATLYNQKQIMQNIMRSYRQILKMNIQNKKKLGEI